MHRPIGNPRVDRVVRCLLCNKLTYLLLAQIGIAFQQPLYGLDEKGIVLVCVSVTATSWYQVGRRTRRTRGRIGDLDICMRWRQASVENGRSNCETVNGGPSTPRRLRQCLWSRSQWFRGWFLLRMWFFRDGRWRWSVTAGFALSERRGRRFFDCAWMVCGWRPTFLVLTRGDPVVDPLLILQIVVFPQAGRMFIEPMHFIKDDLVVLPSLQAR